MTTRTTAPAKPSRQRGRTEKSVRRYAAALIVLAVLAVVLHQVLAAAAGILLVLAVAVFRLRRAYRRHRAGGKSAMRHRAQFQGHATLAEIRRNLTPDQGVPIGTVRSTR
jgi:Flp pilus assembly protein TadB